MMVTRILFALAAVVQLCACSDTSDNTGESTGGALSMGGASGAGSGGSANSGGRGGAAVGECQVDLVNGEQGAQTTNSYVYSYDPKTRRLISAIYTYELDDALRTHKVYGNGDGSAEPVLYWTDEYDEHGNIVQSEHYTSGIRSYTNTYEGDRLVMVEASGQGFATLQVSYFYEDGSVPNAWTRRETQAGSGESRAFIDGKVSVATTFGASGQAIHSWQHFYDAAGRIQAVERDGGYWPSDIPDGTANIRYAWERDSAGTVSAFSQDGTDSHDNPVVNGEPDYRETYSSGCRPLLAQFPWLAHEPGADGYTPRFSTDHF